MRCAASWSTVPRAALLLAAVGAAVLLARDAAVLRCEGDVVLVLPAWWGPGRRLRAAAEELA
jgi:hypothetical protein